MGATAFTSIRFFAHIPLFSVSPSARTIGKPSWLPGAVGKQGGRAGDVSKVFGHPLPKCLDIRYKEGAQQCTTYFRDSKESNRCVGSRQKRITRLELSLVLLCASPLQKRAICTQTKVPSQRQWKAAASFSE